jgi:pimeloyl-ACP methyl ester carboxylesterase
VVLLHGTRFLSNETVRNARQSAVALDIIALIDVLKIQRAVLAGFDWAARIAVNEILIRPSEQTG